MEEQSSPVDSQRCRTEDLQFPLPIGFLLLTGILFLIRLPTYLIGIFQKLQQKSRIERDFPLCIGHRGARLQNLMENSFSAFEYAIQVGAWGIELDTQASRDGQMVVLHDSTLERTCIGQGRVCEMRGEEIQKVFLKNGERIPFLKEVILLYSDKIHLNLEIKKEATVARTRLAIKAVSRILEEILPDPKQITISSFSPFSLYCMWKYAPVWSRFQLIADPVQSQIRGFRGFLLGSMVFPLAWKSRGIVWEKTVVFRKEYLLRLAHWLGLEVWIYTSNSPEEWEKAAQIGVDGVITDFPEEYLQYIDSKKKNFT